MGSYGWPWKQGGAVGMAMVQAALWHSSEWEAGSDPRALGCLPRGQTAELQKA